MLNQVYLSRALSKVFLREEMGQGRGEQERDGKVKSRGTSPSLASDLVFISLEAPLALDMLARGESVP